MKTIISSFSLFLFITACLIFTPVKGYTQVEEEEETVFVIVEKMPAFPGGDEARMKFIRENIKYPQEAKEKGIQGTIHASFIVEKDGKLSNIEILRGIGGGCDEEVMRILTMMPDWESGMQKDEPVRVQFNMPFAFKLDEKEKGKDKDASKKEEPALKPLPN